MPNDGTPDLTELFSFAEGSTPLEGDPTPQMIAGSCVLLQQQLRWRDTQSSGWRGWADCILTRDSLVLEAGSQEIPVKEIQTVRMARDSEEACGQPQEAFVVVSTALGTFVLAAETAAHRRQWIAILTELRRDVLFAASRIGVSLKTLLYLDRSDELRQVRENLRSLTLTDMAAMIVRPPSRNGAKSEKGEGSWSTQIRLPSGRLTWANLDPQDVAPTPEQLHADWLQEYLLTTRCVWEALLDPILFSGESTYSELNDTECGSIVQHIQKRNNRRAIALGLLGEVNLFVSQVLGSKFSDDRGHTAVCPLSRTI
eukprot:COSAG06_NODE_66_length_26393_cov_6.455161_10_plen_313_part_00